LSTKFVEIKALVSKLGVIDFTYIEKTWGGGFSKNFVRKSVTIIFFN
jgi:hypothetical protein